MSRPSPSPVAPRPMALHVRGRNVPLHPALVRLAQRRVTTALKQARPDVRRVDVRLVDLNGPRGGVDQRCRIALEVAGHGSTIVAEATDERIEVAIDRAADRAARQVQQYRRRREGPRRPRHRRAS
ncbi:MAG: HPF/RaiA family ribosome-associated protein [Myxococcota bacterium]